MKIRTDFVTNSSSSSFIVAFPKVPTCAGECEQILFKDKCGAFYSEYYAPTTTRWVADRVYGDIVNGKPATKKELIDEFSHLDSYEGENSPDEYIRTNKHVWSSRDARNPRYDLGMKTIDHGDGTSHSYRETNWDLLQKDREEWGKQKLQHFKEKHKGHKIYIFEYADDGGEGLLEHGDIFRNLPHIRVSHH